MNHDIDHFINHYTDHYISHYMNYDINHYFNQYFNHYIILTFTRSARLAEISVHTSVFISHKPEVCTELPFPLG